VFDSDGTTMAVVARRPQLVQAYMKAQDDKTRGLLFGYPKTAVQAFDSGDVLAVEQQRDLLQAEGLPDASFALSRQHWREELAVLYQWYDMLKAYGISEGQGTRAV